MKFQLPALVMPKLPPAKLPLVNLDRRPIDINTESPLSALAEFYESNQELDEEQSEVDLMIQLSGMTYNGEGSAE